MKHKTKKERERERERTFESMPNVKSVFDYTKKIVNEIYSQRNFPPISYRSQLKLKLLM